MASISCGALFFLRNFAQEISLTRFTTDVDGMADGWLWDDGAPVWRWLCLPLLSDHVFHFPGN